MMGHRAWRRWPRLALAAICLAMLAVIVIESSMYASVMFHDEWRDRTLPVLTMHEKHVKELAVAHQ